MGWWSSTIMGGDTPLDFKGDIFAQAGLEYDGSQLPVHKIKKALEENQEMFNTGIDKILNSWGCGKPTEVYYKDHKSIGFQVLAALMMESGAKINPKMKKMMLRWIPKDLWSTEDDARAKYVQNLIEALKAYDGSKPVEIESEGLFEVFAKKLNIIV